MRGQDHFSGGLEKIPHSLNFSSNLGHGTDRGMGPPRCYGASEGSLGSSLVALSDDDQHGPRVHRPMDEPSACARDASARPERGGEWSVTAARREEGTGREEAKKERAGHSSVWACAGEAPKPRTVGKGRIFCPTGPNRGQHIQEVISSKNDRQGFQVLRPGRGPHGP